MGPDGGPAPYTPRPPREPRPPQDSAPRLGPDGQPLPPKPRRDRKPIGPDANGLGPDGQPWDPARRGQRLAERAAAPSGPSEMNQAPAAAVEATTEPPKE